MLRRPALFSTILFLGLHLFAGSHAEAAFPWYYAVTGPGGTEEITIEEPGAIVYFQFDALTSDYVWGNVRIDFDPTLLECVSIEETPHADGFWTAWITATAEPAYGGGGSLYYYDSTGHGSDWAHYWVDLYGPLSAGPSGSYDNTLGIIRLYTITNAGGLNGSVPLRIGFRIKQTGTAVFHTYASAGESFSWRLEDLPYRHVSTVKIIQQTCVQPPSGMIGWWPGDGNANDIVGGNNGTMQNVAVFAPGKVGQSFNFTSAGDMVQTANNTVHELESLNSATFEGWFKSDGGSWFGDAIIIGKHTCGTAGGWFFTTGQGCYLGDHWIGGYGVNRPDLDDGRFHHFACIKDGTRYYEYIDGVLVSQDTGPSSGRPANEPLMIGSINTGICDSNKHQLYGLADELVIYNRALSDTEIQAVYLAGSAGKCKDNINNPPIANAGPDQTVELTSCAGASVILDGSGSSDPDEDPLTYAWTWPGGSASGIAPTVMLPFGETAVTLTVDDGKGGASTDEVTVSVVDTTAPVLNVSLSPNLLWPPNHKYVQVAPSIAVQDACAESVVVELLSSSSNEPDDGLGDGDTANDITVNADGTLSLRAERSGTGSGRTYTITYKATDQAGNTMEASALATVPHHRQ